MASPVPAPTRIRFDAFELDVTSGELRKNGILLRLQPQPFRVLLLLTERAGQVVTREEIQRFLWTESTFVDFEHGINFSINQIRGALADSAEDPRYVETIPRRGYRFIGDVEQPPAESITVLKRAPGELAKKVAPRRWLTIASLTAIVVVTSSGAAYFHFHHARTLTEKDTIVLADFTNTTGDTVFDGTLRQGLSVQLEQSPFLSIIPDQQIQQTLQMMGQKPDAKLTPEIARELCERTSSAAVLDGSIAQIGTQYLLTLKAINCASGASLASTEAQAATKNEVLDALGKTASEIRNKLGESLRSVQKYDTPLEEASTSSLDALKALSSGLKVWGGAGSAAAIPFFERAIDLDPNFALAHMWLGHMYWSTGDSVLAADALTKSYELRDRASDWEKYFIIASFHIGVTGNIEKARQTCGLWSEAYPRAADPHVMLAVFIYSALGQRERRLEELIEAARLDSNSSGPHTPLIFAYISLDRLDEAKAVYEQDVQRKAYSAFYPKALYQIAFLQNDPLAMAQQVARSQGQQAEPALLGMQADTAAYSGRLSVARKFSREATESAERTQKAELAARLSGRFALSEALFGNLHEAQRRAHLAIANSAERDIQSGAALTLAYAGDDKHAQALADDLNKRFPEDTVIQFIELPNIRARLAINKGNFSEAIESLKPGMPYELREGGEMHAAYVRGIAYLAMHQGREAAAEFQKILDHRGVVINSPTGALARLQIGRAYALQGDSAKARAAYQDFLTLWKDADPDIPILKEAKAEYAKLQ